MIIVGILRSALRRTHVFLKANRGNVAMIFGLALVPISLGVGVGLDLSRALVTRQRMNEALDAAGLAIGAQPGMSNSAMTTLAQQYFAANYTASKTEFGTPAPVTVVHSGQQIALSTSVAMPTTLMNIVGIQTMNVGASSQVTWGQTKLWVAIVLDNTGSMCQPDNCAGTNNKITYEKQATQNLLTMLQGAAANPGDVQVSIIPFTKDVDVGTSNAAASWIDWTDWNSAPPSSTPASSVGPGSSCPYSNGTNGFTCTTGPANGSSSTGTIPSSGAYSGYICPSVASTNASTGLGGHYYNGCYNSVSSIATICSGHSSCSCTGYTNCTCTGSGNSKSCKQTTYSHTWIANNHNTWDGCVMDRTQNYDVQNDVPSGTTTDFPAENAQSCPAATITPLGYNWSALSAQVNTMTANGSTNQPIGLAWGWQSMTNGLPFSPGALPAQTRMVVIILSDGLNTQDRWHGDGSNQDTTVDARENLVCTNIKNNNTTVYAVYVDLNGAQGNSAALQSCATDPSKYFDLTVASQIVTAFTEIGTQITNLRVSL